MKCFLGALVCAFLFQSALAESLTSALRRAYDARRANKPTVELQIYTQALANGELTERQRDRVAVRKGDCLFRLQRAADALQALDNVKTAKTPSFHKLRGKILLNLHRFAEAAACFESASKGFVREEAYLLLSRAQELQAVELTAAGRPIQARQKLHAALDSMLKTAAGRSKSYTSSEAHRTRYLKLRLSKSGGFGAPFQGQIKAFDYQGIVDTVSPLLAESDRALLKNQFDCSDEMKAWAQQTFAKVKDERLKAFLLLYHIQSEGGLRLVENYDEMLHKGKQGFWLGRTAKEVFTEQYQGLASYGHDSDLFYRMGDCESATNLYIALARAIGLKAYMVRLYTDVNRGWVGQHRGAGVVTKDGRLLIIDLSWYKCADAPYTNFRVLSDLESYSYYMVGYNQNNERGRRFLNAAIKLDPKNELALVELAQASMERPAQARALLDRVDEQGKGLDLYWKYLSDLEEKLRGVPAALQVVERSAQYVRSSSTLLKRRAALYERTGKLEEALRDYQATLRLSVLGEQATWCAIAKIHEKRNEAQKAIHAYRQSWVYSNSSTTKPSSLEMIGRIYWKQKDYRRALDSYAQAMESYIGVSGLNLITAIIRLTTMDRLAEIVIDFGTNPPEDVTPETALRLLQWGKRRYPRLGLFQAGIGAVHLKNRQMDKAETEFVQALQGIYRQMPRWILEALRRDGLVNSTATLGAWMRKTTVRSDATLELVDHLARKDRVEEALAICEAGLRPGRCELHKRIGELAWDLGQQDKARAAFRAAGQTSDARLQTKLLDGHVKAGRTKLAGEMAERLLKAPEVDLAALKAICAACERQGTLTAKLDILMELVKKQKADQGPLWTHLGIQAYRAKDLGAAESCFRSALPVSQESCRAADLHNLALMLSKQGKIAEAQQTWQLSLKADPTYSRSLRYYFDSLRKEKRIKEAENVLQQLLANPNLDKEGLKKAIDYYREGGRDAEGLKLAEAAVDGKKSTEELYRVLIAAYRHRSRSAEVIRIGWLYHNAPNRKEKGKTYAILAQECDRLGRVDEHESWLRLSVQAERGRWHKLGRLLADQERLIDLKLLIDDMFSGIKFEPHHLRIYFRYYRETNQMDKGFTRLVERIRRLRKIDRPAAWLALAEQANSERAYHSGLIVCEQALPDTVGSRRLKLLMIKAKLHARIKQLDKAEAMYAELLAKHPGNTDLLWEAYCFIRDNDRPKLRTAMYEQAKKAEPTRMRISVRMLHAKAGGTVLAEWQMLAKMMSKTKASDGWSVLALIASEHELLEQELIARQKGVELTPKNTFCQERLGYCLEKMGRIKEAEIAYREAFENLKGNYRTPEYLSFLVRTKRSGDFESACRAMNQARTINSWEASHLLSQFSRLSRLDAGLRLLKPVAAQEKGSDLRLAIADHLKKERMYREAIASYNTALRKAEGLFDATRSIAECHQYLGEYKEAEKKCREALAASPQDEMTMRILCDSLRKQKKSTDARVFIDAYRSKHPQSVFGFELLALHHLALNEMHDARKAYRKAYDLTHSLSFMLSLIQNCANDEEADRLLSQATKRFEGDPDLTYHLACRSVDKGKYEDAIRLADDGFKASSSCWFLYLKVCAFAMNGRIADSTKLLTDNRQHLALNHCLEAMQGLHAMMCFDLDKAVAAFKQVPKLSAMYDSCQNWIVVCDLWKGNYEQTLKGLAERRKTQENHYFDLIKSDALACLGKCDEARKLLTRFLEQYPGHPAAKCLEASILARTGKAAEAKQLLALLHARSRITRKRLVDWWGISPESAGTILNLL